MQRCKIGGLTNKVQYPTKKESKQSSLHDRMEIVVSINPHSPTRATIASREEIAHPLHLFIFSILFFSNIIFLNAQT